MRLATPSSTHRSELQPSAGPNAGLTPPVERLYHRAFSPALRSVHTRSVCSNLGQETNERGGHVNDSPRYCAQCVHWDPASPVEGRCRRNAPGAHAHPIARDSAEDKTPAAVWPLTLAQDWCGEWQPREAPLAQEEPPMDPEEERFLRNTAIAEALLALPSDKRDRLLLEVLTEEERQLPTPPDDFYERVQEYFASQRDDGSQ